MSASIDNLHSIQGCIDNMKQRLGDNDYLELCNALKGAFDDRKTAEEEEEEDRENEWKSYAISIFVPGFEREIHNNDDTRPNIYKIDCGLREIIIQTKPPNFRFIEGEIKRSGFYRMYYKASGINYNPFKDEGINTTTIVTDEEVVYIKTEYYNIIKIKAL